MSLPAGREAPRAVEGVANLDARPIGHRLAEAMFSPSALSSDQVTSGIVRVGIPILVAVLVVASPWYGIPRLTTSLLVTILLYGIAASGLNLMFGYAGMLSLGSGIFVGIGAYTAAVVDQRFGLPMAASVLVGIFASAVSGALLGAMLVRLSGHYFGVATLALALAFDALVTALSFTGGGTGLTTSTRLPLGIVTIASNTQWYLFILVVTACMIAVLAWFVAGRRGRLLRLVRADELAASVLGVRVYVLKLVAFVLGALFAGVAGSLLFVSQGLVDPESVGTLISVEMAMLVVIGGPGYRVGGIVGAFLVLWLQALLNSFGNYELLVYGAALLAVVFYLRPGLEGALVAIWRVFLRRMGIATGASSVLFARAKEGAGNAQPASALGAGVGLEVRGASVRFGGLVAVDEVSLTAPAGRVTALIGGNGAGKSTLLNAISGVERLECGSVCLGGVDVSGMTPAERTRRGIMRTFQVPRLVDELTVVENMVLGHEAADRSLLRRRRKNEQALQARARATLERLGLADLSDRLASSLGTGERKYVEVARAVLTDAAVVLLDEPAVGLSMEEVDQLRVWLADMRDRGAAVLVIDHNMDFIRELADTVYVMDSGRVVWHGPPTALPDPASLTSSGLGASFGSA
jgi:ABC-type branched-subunit amino acid transport system ATPase component/ABC-type branched-subunit amino acid transport system permease subunit